MLRATTACIFFNITTSKSAPNPTDVHTFDFEMPSRHNGVHFSTSQLPKVFRIWCALTILASHHNNVHFFHITTSKSDPNPTVFHIISPDGSTPAALVSLLFDPPEPQHIGKHSAWQIFYLFEHLDLLSSSLTLPTSALPSVHIFGSSTSKMSFDTRMV